MTKDFTGYTSWIADSFASFKTVFTPVWLFPFVVTPFIIALLTGCLGSSSSPSEPVAPPPPSPPDVSDIIRYNHLGLADVAVETLFVTGDGVWVAGDQGIFFSSNLSATNEEEANWQQQLEGIHILHMQGFHAQEIYAIGVETINTPYVLLRSTDRGQTWQPLAHDFGGKSSDVSSNLEVLYADTETGYLYGAGQQAIAVSYDHGTQWQLLSGGWDTIALSAKLLLHPVHNDLWLGGQNAIEESTLVRYSLNQKTTDMWNGLLPSPSVNQTIAFDRASPDRLIIGAEGGLLSSVDYGNTWDTLLVDTNAFYFDVLQSPLDNNVWYSARWQKGLEPHPLQFIYSTDNGESWQTSQHPASERNYGVRSMQFVNAGQTRSDVMWAVLQSGRWSGGGVMRIGVDLEVFH